MSHPDLDSTPPSTRRRWLPFLLLFLLAALPFLTAINGEFTWDDDQWLVNNSIVHAWNGLHLIWNPLIQPLHFYPVLFTALWLQHKLWGLAPIGYHLTSILFHATSTLLLYNILRRLNLRAAWLAALLWAIHPVQVDTVAWVAEQKNTLSGIFYFLSALLFLKFAEIPQSLDPATAKTRALHYGLSLLSFVAALLSKTVVCTLPAALLLLLWWKGRLTRKNALLLLPFFLLAAVPSIGTTLQERLVITVGGAENFHLSLLQRFFIAGKDVWFYLRTLVFPFPLMAIYPKWTLNPAGPLNYLAPLAVALALCATFLLRKRITNAPFIAFAYFLVTLSPALGFINFYTMHYTFVADHYQYLACLGPLALFAEGLFRVRENRNAKIQGPLIAIPVSLIAALASLSLFYASLFQTNFKIWSWNVDHNPNAYVAQFNLAIQYAAQGKVELAHQHASFGLSLAPDDSAIHLGFGRFLMNEEKYDEAAAQFRISASIRPGIAEPYQLLGEALDKLHRPQEALDAYEKAVSLAGSDPKPYRAYAEALLRAHRDEEALAQFEKAVDVDPGNFITRYNYANHLLDANRFADAVVQYQFILKYQPNNPAVWDNLAYAYHQLGQNDKALAAKQRADELDHAHK